MVIQLFLLILNNLYSGKVRFVNAKIELSKNSPNQSSLFAKNINKKNEIIKLTKINIPIFLLNFFHLNSHILMSMKLFGDCPDKCVFLNKKG